MRSARVWYVVFFALSSSAAHLRADEARDQLIVETVLRLDSFDYGSASEKVKGAIGRFLGSNRGSDEYFDLVSKFAITDQISALAELASAKNANPRAAALLVKLGGAEAVKTALARSGEERGKLLASLGSVNDSAAVDALTDLLGDESAARDASKALSGSPAGQAKLLDLAAAGELPVALKSGVGVALAASADPKVRARAAEILPMPAALGGGTLPPVTELSKRHGNAKKGELIYMRSCFVCHKIGDKGLDFGPALTEIGGKLPREALYTAILDPNEAISFGYEGFEVKTKAGTTLIGYVASDGDTELGMKVPGGALVNTPKAEIVSKQPLTVSLMPSNLQATMGADDLVDLVEYLSGLKK